MNLLNIARQLFDESKLSMETNVCHHILQIDISEMQYEFWPVICLLTEHVMHMDKAGFLWPCGGCTKSGNWMSFHEIYCPCNIMHDCNPKIKLKDSPSNEVCIPIEFKDAYKTFLYLELCKHSMSLCHAAARNCGGEYFNLKSVLGPDMLLDDDCNAIFCILSHEPSNHNSVRKWMLMESTLEENVTDEMDKVEATKIIVNAATKCWQSNVTLNTQRKDTVKDKKRIRKEQEKWQCGRWGNERTNNK